jgi:protein-tyrosine phosphatase
MDTGGDGVPANLAPFYKSEHGDRIVMDNGEQVLITAINTSPHNFGPVSNRDMTVCTCQRPGGDAGPGRLETSLVLPEWIEYIKNQNDVTNVIILMSENELQEAYEGSLIHAYENAGMTQVYHVPMSSPGAHDKIMTILNDVERRGERVTAHCTHGMGRSGRVAAAWLVHRYNLSLEQATMEVLEMARKNGVERMGAPWRLQAWISAK